MKNKILIISALITLAACKKPVIDEKLPSGTLIQVDISSNYENVNLKVENLTNGSMVFDIHSTDLVDTLKKEALTGCIFRTNNKDTYKISYEVADTNQIGYLKEPLNSNMKVFVIGYEKANRPGKKKIVSSHQIFFDEYYLN